MPISTRMSQTTKICEFVVFWTNGINLQGNLYDRTILLGLESWDIVLSWHIDLWTYGSFVYGNIFNDFTPPPLSFSYAQTAIQNFTG